MNPPDLSSQRLVKRMCVRLMERAMWELLGMAVEAVALEELSVVAKVAFAAQLEKDGPEHTCTQHCRGAARSLLQLAVGMGLPQARYAEDHWMAMGLYA